MTAIMPVLGSDVAAWLRVFWVALQVQGMVAKRTTWTQAGRVRPAKKTLSPSLVWVAQEFYKYMEDEGLLVGPSQRLTQAAMDRPVTTTELSVPVLCLR